MLVAVSSCSCLLSDACGKYDNRTWLRKKRLTAAYTSRLYIIGKVRAGTENRSDDRDHGGKLALWHMFHAVLHSPDPLA